MSFSTKPFSAASFADQSHGLRGDSARLSTHLVGQIKSIEFMQYLTLKEVGGDPVINAPPTGPSAKNAQRLDMICEAQIAAEKTQSLFKPGNKRSIIRETNGEAYVHDIRSYNVWGYDYSRGSKVPPTHIETQKAGEIEGFASCQSHSYSFAEQMCRQAKKRGQSALAADIYIINDVKHYHTVARYGNNLSDTWRGYVVEVPDSPMNKHLEHCLPPTIIPADGIDKQLQTADAAKEKVEAQRNKKGFDQQYSGFTDWASKAIAKSLQDGLINQNPDEPEFWDDQNVLSKPFCWKNETILDDCEHDEITEAAQTILDRLRVPAAKQPDLLAKITNEDSLRNLLKNPID